MYVRVGTDGPTVEDVRNLRQLHVELDGVDDATGAAAIAEAGLGTLEGEHVWLRITELRAAGENTNTWRADFDSMITYATTRGWVDGDRVRTHIVRP